MIKLSRDTVNAILVLAKQNRGDNITAWGQWLSSQNNLGLRTHFECYICDKYITFSPDQSPEDKQQMCYKHAINHLKNRNLLPFV